MYTSLDGAEREENLVVLLCACRVSVQEMGPILSCVFPELREIFGATLDHSLYEPLTAPFTPTTTRPNHILVIVSMTPDPAAEDSFNNWYAEEHIPLLSRVPTWLSSQRLILISSTRNDAPRYTAIHCWGDIAAFNTEEYAAATNTPWRTKVIDEVIHRERLDFRFVGELAELAVKSQKS